jgi:hypothetical protein
LAILPSTIFSITGSRLACGRSLRAINLLLALQIFGGHVLRLHIARIAGRDVHRDVLQQLLEVLGAGHKVALAVQLEQHADLAAGMDIGAHRALVGGAGSLLLRRGHAPLAQHHKRASMSPLVSCKAFRQSPIGAPDFSRSSFTSLASIFSLTVVISLFLLRFPVPVTEFPFAFTSSLSCCNVSAA